MKPCEHMKDYLMWHACDELDAKRQQEVTDHLETCPGCREEVARLRILTQMLRSGAAPEIDGVTQAQLRQSLLQKLAARPQRPGAVRPFGGGLFQPAPLIQAAVAMLLVAFGFWLGQMRIRSTETNTPLQTLLTGIQPIQYQQQAIHPTLAGIDKLRYNPKTGEIEIQYNTINDITYQGSVYQPQAQQLLAQAMIREESPAVRLHAVKAVSGIVNQEGELTDELMQSMADLLQKEQNQGVRLAALRVLKSVPLTETSQKILVQILLYDENMALRIEAFESLYQNHLQESSLTPFLRSMEQDTSSYLRYRATQLLKQMQAENQPVKSAQLSREN